MKEKRKKKKKIEKKKESKKSEDKIENIQIRKKKTKKTSRARKRFFILIGTLVFLIVSAFLIYMKMIKSLVVLASLLILSFGYLIIRKKLKKYSDIKKMEEAFPDFISLMSSNLRAGMTIDKALLLSSRKEFAPLDKEINNLGKDIVTGKEINQALRDMSERINSEEIRKTVLLIISGIKSGGNLSVLLEQVSSSMRERGFVKKRASSNVLMYVIFIFFAVSLGAPILFGLSSVLVGILTDIVSSLPSEQLVNINTPFVFTEINISVEFILYFSIAFIIVTDIFASLILGLVSKGRERDGLKYIIPLILISLTIFFVSRIVINSYFPSFLG